MSAMERQPLHDFASRLSCWADQWLQFSNHPDAKSHRREDEVIRRRIAAAIAVLQAELPKFKVNADPGPNTITKLRYAIDRAAPMFPRNHGGAERWHRIADDIKRCLLQHYKTPRPKPGQVICFIGDALALMGINATDESIRKRPKTGNK
ncbi:hypothetical protein [Acidiphilium acidophilum]|uniref:hypothetical protein n=1 Tax=Acidiphilium acidophilum TaxID=76588 RepID=UPI002E8E755E|nr:hypothetical protein [Acidiphilium acidophilum]